MIGDDRWFNAFRTSQNESVHQLIEGVVASVLAFEEKAEYRARRRKAADYETLIRQIESLVCDAILENLIGPDSWLMVSLSKENLREAVRYRSAVMSKTLSRVLSCLGHDGVGVLDIRWGRRMPGNPELNKVTTFRLSSAFKQHVACLQFTGADFGVDELQEVLILKGVKDDGSKNAKSLPYEDTPQTEQYRDDLRSINSWIAQADLQLDSDGVTAVPHDRRLRRVFNNASFNEGGRIFGGFWMPMSKAKRQEVRLDGKPMITLDYSQMGPRILYGLVGQPFDDGDAYSLPSMEAYRDGVKRMFGAMMFYKTPMRQFPKGLDEFIGSGITAKRVSDAILVKHPLIKHLFYGGLGLSCMFKESEILMEVLLRLRGLQIVALPIHDAIMVSEDMQDTASVVMLEVFRTMTGIDGLVKVETNQ